MTNVLVLPHPFRGRLRRRRADVAPRVRSRFDLSPTDALAAFTDDVEVPAGVTLVRAGSVPNQVIELVEGNVRIRDELGNEHLVGPGARFGRDGTLRGEASTVTAVVEEPGARVLVVFGPAYRWASAGLL